MAAESALSPAKQYTLNVYQEIYAGEWRKVLLRASCGDLLWVVSKAWPQIPLNERPKVLADAISGEIGTARHRRFLIRALRELLALGPCLFDSDAARQRFEQLPECITIYRGTCEAEGRRYGFSWTLDRDRAVWFATEYDVLRKAESPAVILQCEVAKADVSGYLVERQESEIIIHPSALRGRAVLRVKVIA